MNASELADEVLGGAAPAIDAPEPDEDNLAEAVAETESADPATELAELAEFKSTVGTATAELAAELVAPVTFRKLECGGYAVESGTFWIPGPFVEPAGGWPKKKTKAGKAIKPKVSAAAKRRAILAGWAETLAWAYDVDTAYAA